MHLLFLNTASDPPSELPLSIPFAWGPNFGTLETLHKVEKIMSQHDFEKLYILDPTIFLWEMYGSST